MPVAIILPDSWGRWFHDDDTYMSTFLGLTPDASAIVEASRGKFIAPFPSDRKLKLMFELDSDAIEFKLKYM